MVYQVVIKDKRYYACGGCGLIYESQATAGMCEEWCRAHKTCNTSIAQKAIGYLREARGTPKTRVGSKQ